ncbi:MAG: HD domain-containing protein [Halobacteriales archaeon]
MGVEIKESPVTDEEFERMKEFVYEYLAASVQSEDGGERMRWYPWHSADYRYNHILNVVDLASKIADREGADKDIVKVAALFHDIAKLEAEQDVHAEAGARVAREYLETHGDFPASFVDRVCKSIEEHSYQESVTDLSLETQCLIEADILDKIGANGMALMLLRMGYEARTHMDAAEMVQRVLDRGIDALSRIESQTAHDIATRRLKRVKWFREWLEIEVAEMSVDEPIDPRPDS